MYRRNEIPKDHRVVILLIFFMEHRPTSSFILNSITFYIDISDTRSDKYASIFFLSFFQESTWQNEHPCMSRGLAFPFFIQKEAHCYEVEPG